MNHELVWNQLLINPLVLDIETTTSNKGNIHDITNKLVLIQIHDINKNESYTTQDAFDPYLNTKLNNTSCISGANLKFDLGWLRFITNYQYDKPIWDVQLAEFLFSAQRWPFPDLNSIGEKYQVGHKIDKIKHYWDQGIDTDKIPLHELIEYGINDCLLTREIFLKQIELFKTTEKSKFPLFRLQSNDQKVLLEMEYNGLIFDEQASKLATDHYKELITKIDLTLDKLINSPVKLNYNSNDDISIILYGGKKKVKTKIPIGEFKTGNRIGQTKYKIIETELLFPQQVQPLKNSELKKEGFFSTDIATLSSLNAKREVKKIISLLLERSKYIKLIGTYLEGLPNLRVKMNWPYNRLYPSYNQCQANTGRLSSSQPNAQNQTPESKKYFISRYT